MTYVYCMILAWVLPLSGLGDRDYTIREQTQRRVAGWGLLAAPALQQELLRPHSEESYSRAEVLLDRLPTVPTLACRVLIHGGHTGVTDETLAALAPTLLVRLHALDLIPAHMDWDWASTGGHSFPEAASPDTATYYTAWAMRLALDSALTTRMMRWYFGSWYRPN